MDAGARQDGPLVHKYTQLRCSGRSVMQSNPFAECLRMCERTCVCVCEIVSAGSVENPCNFSPKSGQTRRLNSCRHVNELSAKPSSLMHRTATTQRCRLRFLRATWHFGR